MNKQPTGKAVRDVKGPTTEIPPVPATNRIQIHQGNIPVVTAQLLNDINIKLGKILDLMEKNNG